MQIKSKFSFGAMILLLSMAVLMVNSLAAKPLSSVSVKMQWQGELEYDETMELQLSVFSHVSTDAMVVDVSLPDGVELLEGEKRFILSIKKMQPENRILRLRIKPDAKGQIKAEVRTGGNGKTAFYAVTGIEVQQNTATKSLAPRTLSPKSSESPEFRRTQRNGELLREYRLPN